MAYDAKLDTTVQLLIAQSPLGQQSIMGGMLLSDLVAMTSIHAQLSLHENYESDKNIVAEAFCMADEFLKQRAARIAEANAKAEIQKGHA